jgi:hypothetical protein
VKPIAIFYLLAATVPAAYAVFALRTGRARFQLWMDERSKNPHAFWFDIALYVLLSGVLLTCAVVVAFFE